MSDIKLTVCFTPTKVTLERERCPTHHKRNPAVEVVEEVQDDRQERERKTPLLLEEKRIQVIVKHQQSEHQEQLDMSNKWQEKR